MKKKTRGPLKHRNLLLCAAWTGGCVLVSLLLWLCTRSIRGDVLAQAVNLVMARTGEARRLSAPLGGAGGLGTWFSLTEVPRGDAAPGTALVFTLFNGSRSAACAAMLDEDGRMEKIIPLSDHAALVAGDLPDPVYRIYKDRIEAAAKIMKKKDGT